MSVAVLSVPQRASAEPEPKPEPLTARSLMGELIVGKVLVIGVDQREKAKDLTGPGMPFEGLSVRVSAKVDPDSWELF